MASAQESEQLLCESKEERSSFSQEEAFRKVWCASRTLKDEGEDEVRGREKGEVRLKASLGTQDPPP